MTEAEYHIKHCAVPQKYLDLIEMDPGEEVVCGIRKHPIGLLAIYLTGFFVSATVIIATVVLALILQSSASAQSTHLLSLIIIAAGFLVGLVTLLLTYVSGYIYQNNIIIVTTEKIAQILYKTIISRTISQLSLGEMQDVTVFQRTILSRLFHYGELVIETAGEQDNYHFTFTPYPYHCAKELVAAHDANIKKYGN